LGPVAEFIEEILRADQMAPRKQRHTAHRIWERIRQERADVVAEATVRRFVRERKQELGLRTRETFVPQVYDWGGEAQVDWYEVYADLAGERIKLQVFAMRSMASGAAFRCAYARDAAGISGSARAGLRLLWGRRSLMVSSP
jgi:transposase